MVLVKFYKTTFATLNLRIEENLGFMISRFAPSPLFLYGYEAQSTDCDLQNTNEK
jgi:hypothetical protein